MKPLHWVASSKKDVLDFPEEVRSEVGYTLFLAQKGDKGLNAVPMVGFGSAKVLEVVIDDDGDAYRAVYTVKFQRAVYVLHAFQKKSKSGVSTPQPELRLIRLRLKVAESDYEQRYGKASQKEQKNDRRA